MVSVSKKLGPSDMENASVVIDFADKKVLKCVIEGKPHDTDFDKMREYYVRVYPTLIEQLEREAPITAAISGTPGAMNRQARRAAAKK